uniref:Secreted protein n=1 Tax=Ascaris lumbricoides TaxID=6252 RepID=A0A0M3HTW9_ASCLU
MRFRIHLSKIACMLVDLGSFPVRINFSAFYKIFFIVKFFVHCFFIMSIDSCYLKKTKRSSLFEENLCAFPSPSSSFASYYRKPLQQ